MIFYITQPSGWAHHYRTLKTAATAAGAGAATVQPKTISHGSQMSAMHRCACGERGSCEPRDIYEALLTPFVNGPIVLPHDTRTNGTIPNHHHHFSHLFAAKYFITKSAYVFNLTKIFSYTIILPGNLINARSPGPARHARIHFIVVWLCCCLVGWLFGHSVGLLPVFWLPPLTRW